MKTDIQAPSGFNVLHNKVLIKGEDERPLISLGIFASVMHASLRGNVLSRLMCERLHGRAVLDIAWVQMRWFRTLRRWLSGLALLLHFSFRAFQR